MTGTDRHIVVANYQCGTKIVKNGARAFVLRVPGSCDSANVIVHSRGGRVIEKYESMRRLGNFRIKTVVREGCHPRVWEYAAVSREACERDLEWCLTIRMSLSTVDRDLGDEDRIP